MRRKSKTTTFTIAAFNYKFENLVAELLIIRKNSFHFDFFPRKYC